MSMVVKHKSGSHGVPLVVDIRVVRMAYHSLSIHRRRILLKIAVTNQEEIL